MMFIKLILGLLGLGAFGVAIMMAVSLGALVEEHMAAIKAKTISNQDSRRILMSVWIGGIAFLIGWALTIIATAY